MRKIKTLPVILAILCCAVTVGAWSLKTTAASNTASVGNFSASDNRVLFRSEDINYLNKELERLQNEMDDSVFGSASVDVTVSASADMRRRMLASHGIINYDNGKVTANAANLFSLADGTDALGNAYATAICRALNEIGTYFDLNGNVNHAAQTAEAIVLGCERLAEGILQSQSVDHLAAVPVTADNITAGAAAWVNGQCIIGNGADNERAYQRGIEDGAARNGDEVEMQYTYHEHTGNGQSGFSDGHVLYQSDNPGGCFRSSGHTHNQAGSSCENRTGYREETWACARTDWTYNESVDRWQCGLGHMREFAEPGVDVCGALTTERIRYSYWDCNGDGEGAQGERVNTWKIGCGKRAGQTETATITIRKNSGT